jgi:purine-binding chemotaxis protein CheW
MNQISSNPVPTVTRTPPRGPLDHAGNGERQILTFTLGLHPEGLAEGAPVQATDYGIDLMDVQEIRGYIPATPIPNTPPYIKGAMNLRGVVIPVIDLRIRFGVQKVEYSKFTVIIVVNVTGKTVGLVADKVSDVLSLTAAEILPPPDFGMESSGDSVDAIANINGNLVLLLNLRKMLAPDGIADPAATS